MDKAQARIILASGSPRRREILRNAGIDFEVMVTDADETVDGDLTPQEIVSSVSTRKAEAAVEAFRQRGGERAVVIAADTIVHIGGKVLGKPADSAEAFAFLKLLTGNRHDVYTGVAVAFVGNDGVEYAQDSCRTSVKFKPLTDAQIREYIDTGEPFDKAGAYAIQGRGEKLVDSIIGDYNNVVGLPLDLLLGILERPPNSALNPFPTAPRTPHGRCGGTNPPA